ncbi:hypothetical protein RF55_22461 [Lasius niger]|uniref:Uncharacterized protein n=1 Tax=Lasius niger TaxID=67767 RepID=A0A0J7JWZ6_LASNI|nr:hypothetical protein RF55_22461 [Lasius niger]
MAYHKFRHRVRGQEERRDLIRNPSTHINMTPERAFNPKVAPLGPCTIPNQTVHGKSRFPLQEEVYRRNLEHPL